MPFQVILQTTPTEDVGNAWVSLNFRTPNGPLEAKLAFGEPSRNEGAVFEFASGYPKQSSLSDFDTGVRYVDQPAVRVDVFGTVHTQTGQVGFSLKNLFSNDTLHMIALSRRLFLGNVFHVTHGVPTSHAPCVATCANGKSAQGCVTCVQGEIMVKICC